MRAFGNAAALRVAGKTRQCRTGGVYRDSVSDCRHTSHHTTTTNTIPATLPPCHPACHPATLHATLPATLPPCPPPCLPPCHPLLPPSARCPVLPCPVTMATNATKRSMKTSSISAPGPTPATSPVPLTSPTSPVPSTSATSPPVPSTSATSPINTSDGEVLMNIADDDGEVLDVDESEENLDEVDQEQGQDQPTQPKKRRRKSTNIILTEAQERMLGDWLEQVVPYLYDKGDNRHKEKEHIDHVWAEKAASLDPPITASELLTWFTSLRSKFGRLTKDKSGEGAKRLTEREKWILTMFHFLKPHIVRQKKPRNLGMPQSAAQAAETSPVCGPLPDDPAPADADEEDQAAGSQENTTPAISMPPRRTKQGKPPGAVPAAHGSGTLEQVLATAEQVRQNLAGVAGLVEDPELQYWRASMDVLAKDCVGLPPKFKNPFKSELMAALHRFKTAFEEGVTTVGPDLMLHAIRNYGIPAPQPQPQPPQPQPTATVMYQGNPTITLPQSVLPKPAPTYVLPPHQLAALQSLIMRPPQSATPPATFHPPTTSTPTHLDLSQLSSQFGLGNTSFNFENYLSASSPAPSNPATPAPNIDPEQTLETPKKQPSLETPKML